MKTVQIKSSYFLVKIFEKWILNFMMGWESGASTIGKPKFIAETGCSIYLHCSDIIKQADCQILRFEDMESIYSDVAFQVEESGGNGGNMGVAWDPDFSTAWGVEDEHAYFCGFRSP